MFDPIPRQQSSACWRQVHWTFHTGLHQSHSVIHNTWVYLFSTEPRGCLGRTSPKWPILCRVGCKTLLHPSILTLHITYWHLFFFTILSTFCIYLYCFSRLQFCQTCKVTISLITLNNWSLTKLATWTSVHVIYGSQFPLHTTAQCMCWICTLVSCISESRIPSHSFIPGLKPSFLQILLFLLQGGLFTNTSEHIRFYFLVLLLFHFLVIGSVWQTKLTYVNFWAHVKITSRIVSLH